MDMLPWRCAAAVATGCLSACEAARVLGWPVAADGIGTGVTSDAQPRAGGAGWQLGEMAGSGGGQGPAVRSQSRATVGTVVAGGAGGGADDPELERRGSVGRLVRAAAGTPLARFGSNGSTWLEGEGEGGGEGLGRVAPGSSGGTPSGSPVPLPIMGASGTGGDDHVVTSVPSVRASLRAALEACRAGTGVR